MCGQVARRLLGGEAGGPSPGFFDCTETRLPQIAVDRQQLALSAENRSSQGQAFLAMTATALADVVGGDFSLE